MFQKKDIKEIYPLSPMQEGMLFHSIMDGAIGTYFEQVTITVEGDIDVDLFEKSLNGVISKYDILRAVFVYKKSKQPLQAILKERKTKVYFEDLSLMKGDEKIAFVEEYKQKDKNIGFDLSKDILIRMAIFKTDEKTSKIILSFHHIVLDGWSLGIVIDDLFNNYKTLIDDNNISITHTTPYSQFIKWIQQQEKEVEGTTYWRQYLQGYEVKAEIPFTLKGKKEDKGYNLGERTFSLSEALTNKLSHLAKQKGVTVNTIFQMAWGLLLQKYNNTDDVVFGSIVSGRPSEIEGIEKMVGLFINIIPVRMKFDTNCSFNEIIGEIQNRAFQSSKYDYLPLVNIQAETELKRELLNHIVVFENYPLDEEIGNISSKKGLDFTIKDVEAFEQTNYDFNVVVGPGKALTIKFAYNTRVYDEKLMAKLQEHLVNVLHQITEKPEGKLSEIEMLSEVEKHEIIYEFNNSTTNYPKEKTIQALFEEQVKKTPNKIALVYEAKEVTYQQLNEKANSLAKSLREKGVAKNSIVGIMVDRSIEMVVGLMAILKAGGAYLPIDPQLPVERIRYMLTDCSVGLLLAQRDYVDTFEFDGEWVELNTTKSYSDCKENLPQVNNSSDLAYVMYTSGSTGNPKGVTIPHYSVVRVVKESNFITVNERDTILQSSNYAFDGSVFEIYGSILNGAKLILVNKENMLEIEKLADLIKKHNITIIPATTALFNAIVDIDVTCLAQARKIIFGGEKISVFHSKKALEVMGRDKIIHVYGPTESTVCATYYFVNEIKDEENTLPIGKPLSNTSIYILDKYNKPLPVGVVGELCISGDGLGLGYINNEELTKAKFIENPFVVGEKMYKTGDLAKWLPDGNIEFVGRIDHQVKIRGFRIELGEIESALLNIETVEEAVVIVRENNGNKNICGYVVTNKVGTVADYKEELRKHLPDYMIPTYIINLDKMPINLNGKIDRKALPLPEEDATVGENYEDARNEIEETLVGAWKEVLGIQRIGINDNFFELGGDSIKGMKIIALLRKAGLQLSIQDLMKTQTIHHLSLCVKTTEAIPQEVVSGEVKLSPIQKQLFEINKENMKYFNQSIVLFAEKGFDANIVETVFTKIVEHHDGLRMVYPQENGYMKQINRGLKDGLIEIKVVDISKLNQEEIQSLCHEVEGSMNLQTGPLVKLCIMKESKGDHLLIVINHLVVDGVSWRIILEDFTIGYLQAIKKEEIKFAPKTHSFKYWIEKIYEYANSNKLLEEIDYWKDVLNSEGYSLALDGVKTHRRIKHRKTISLEMSEVNTSYLLTQANKPYNTQTHQLLLIALATCINKWKGNKEIVVAVEGHGREPIYENIDINRTVGWFTSVYPVKLEVVSNDIKENINFAKNTLMKIPNNGIGYGILKNITNPINIGNLEFDKNPEIMFNYLGQVDQDFNTNIFKSSNLQLKHDGGEELVLDHALDFATIIGNSKLKISISYYEGEFKKECIEELGELYKNELVNIVNHCIKVYNQQNNKNATKEVAVLLNEKKNKNVFLCSPYMPKSLYEMAYTNLAEYVENYGLYRLDLINDRDFVYKYCDIITDIQKEGPYLLMGYSYGGTVAFEIAHELQIRGYETSDVILIDSNVLEVDTKGKLNLDEIKDLPELIKQFSELKTNYPYYGDIVTTKKKLNGNIHLLRGDITGIEVKDNGHMWKQLTNKSYYEYKVKGHHNEILSHKYKRDNCGLINDILNSIHS